MIHPGDCFCEHIAAFFFVERIASNFQLHGYRLHNNTVNPKVLCHRRI